MSNFSILTEIFFLFSKLKKFFAVKPGIENLAFPILGQKVENGDSQNMGFGKVISDFKSKIEIIFWKSMKCTEKIKFYPKKYS